MKSMQYGSVSNFATQFLSIWGKHKYSAAFYYLILFCLLLRVQYTHTTYSQKEEKKNILPLCNFKNLSLIATFPPPFLAQRRSSFYLSALNSLSPPIFDVWNVAKHLRLLLQFFFSDALGNMTVDFLKSSFFEFQTRLLLEWHRFSPKIYMHR